MSAKNKYKSPITNIKPNVYNNTVNQKVPNDPVEASVEPEVVEPEAVEAKSASPLTTCSENISFEYKVVVIRNNQDIFQTTVTEHLNDGWELSGGVSCTMYADSYSASTIWAQAVYKKVSN